MASNHQQSSSLPRTRKRKGRGNNIIYSGDGKRILYQDRQIRSSQIERLQITDTNLIDNNNNTNIAETETVLLWEQLQGSLWCKYCGSKITLNYEYVDFNNPDSKPQIMNIDGTTPHSCAAKAAVKGYYKQEDFNQIELTNDDDKEIEEFFHSLQNTGKDILVIEEFKNEVKKRQGRFDETE